MRSSGEDEGWSAWLGEVAGGLGVEDASRLGRIADAVIDRARLGAGDRVLDLGAGTGLLSLRAARAVGPRGRVTALDADKTCLARLEAAAGAAGAHNVSTTTGALESLPFEDASFDAAVCRSALTYTLDIAGALREMVRVLEPTGRFSVFEPLPGESVWVTGGCLGEEEDDFARIERTLASRRASYNRDRAFVRGAFEEAGIADFASLPVHFTVNMVSRDPDEIAREYLDDLPGEMSASRILKDVMDGSRVRDVIGAFARAASAGDVRGSVWGLYVWGGAPGSRELA